MGQDAFLCLAISKPMWQWVGVVPLVAFYALTQATAWHATPLSSIKAQTIAAIRFVLQDSSKIQLIPLVTLAYLTALHVIHQETAWVATQQPILDSSITQDVYLCQDTLRVIYLWVENVQLAAFNASTKVSASNVV